MNDAQKISTASAVWQPPLPAEERNYPMNCWWVAGFGDEVGEDLLARWLCDTPVLLYRKSDGTIAAIEDRCPHRSAPLHLGCRKGDNVQCGYHGFTFAADGSCVDVPSMKSPPAAMRVQSFPVIESYPFVWVYLGDPAKIDEVPQPHALDWIEKDGFVDRHGRMDIAANYMLLKENVLDLTHFGYVHAKSFGITDWVNPPRLTGEDDWCGYAQSFHASPMPPIFADPLGLPVGTPYDRENYGRFVSPALQVACVDFIEPESKQITGRFRITHATTPIDPTHMHYFWVVARDFGTSETEMEALRTGTLVGFAEDETMIEAVQALQNRDPRPTAQMEKSVKADGPGVKARRLVQKWMERETL